MLGIMIYKWMQVSRSGKRGIVHRRCVIGRSNQCQVLGDLCSCTQPLIVGAMHVAKVFRRTCLTSKQEVVPHSTPQFLERRVHTFSLTLYTVLAPSCGARWSGGKVAVRPKRSGHRVPATDHGVDRLWDIIAIHLPQHLHSARDNFLGPHGFEILCKATLIFGIQYRLALGMEKVAKVRPAVRLTGWHHARDPKLARVPKGRAIKRKVGLVQPVGRCIDQASAATTST